MRIVLFALLAIALLFLFYQVTRVEDSSKITMKNVPKEISETVELLKDINITQLDTAVLYLIKLADHGIPMIIDSTTQRAQQYLKLTNNSYDKALKRADNRINTPLQKVVRIAISNIPFVGIPYSLVIPYWQKVRYLLLVASLNNHTVDDTVVTEGIKECLVGYAFNSMGQKAGEKVISKGFSWFDKFCSTFGIKAFSKIMSVPVQSLLVFLENDKVIIECGKEKFGQ